MVEDMPIRGLEATTQTSYLSAIEAFAGLLGRSPDSATPAELRAWQLHMARTQISIPTYNHRIPVLRFFFTVKGRDRQKVMLLATSELIRRFLLHVLPNQPMASRAIISFQGFGSVM
jgi:hypothetical protein